MREVKVLPHFRKAIDGRAVTGIFSVFGNIDSYKDIVLPGAFTKTVAERGDDIFHLWQHDFDSPAIAVVKDLRELRQDELPDEIKGKYPEATGGEQVTREYLDTERGNEILKGHESGVPYKMSFAFDPVKFKFGEQGEIKVRFLQENRLFETSDVLWGANDATVASKQAPSTKAITAALLSLKAGDYAALWEAQDECYDLAGGASAFGSVAYLLSGECEDAAQAAPLIAALRMLLSFLDGEVNAVESAIAANSGTLQLMALPGLEQQVKALLKMGARHSDSDVKLINSLHGMVVDLGATNCQGVKSAEPESRAEIIPVSLTLEKAKLFLLQYN